MTKLSQNAKNVALNPEFPKLIHDHYREYSHKIEILKLKQKTENVENYDSHYHGNVYLHFLDRSTISQKKLQVEVLQFSNGLITSKQDDTILIFAKRTKASQSYQPQKLSVCSTSIRNSIKQLYGNQFNLNSCDNKQTAEPNNHDFSQRNKRSY